MCGLAMSTDVALTWSMLEVLAHRGKDERRVVAHRNKIWLGQNRLAIVDLTPAASQPLVTAASIVAFNGEIFNCDTLGLAMLADANPIKPKVVNEIHVIEALMRRHRKSFERFLDGYYAIALIDRGRQQIVLSRDIIGVVPLYYQRKKGQLPFAVASEKKALVKPIEVKPGQTLTFTLEGKLLKQRVYDPISLHMEMLELDHLDMLFRRAVRRRITHSDKPVCVALSGGLDSSLVLAVAHQIDPNIEAVTVGFDPNSEEVNNARMLCEHLHIRRHRIVLLSDALIAKHREAILYHLEDPVHNPIKYAAMIRNYFTAMDAPGTVILCGEGADEVGCGYPPHLARRGLELEWKSFSTLRSMRAINLDRVNKGGMAFTREYRTPFLDRALVLYMMGCSKLPGKQYFRELAMRYDLPGYILSKAKYSPEETKLWALVNSWRVEQAA